MYYVPGARDFLGQIAPDPGPDLARAVDVAHTSAEQLAVCTPDGAAGLWLDFQAAAAEHGTPRPYELAVWGEAWLRLAGETLPFEFAT